METTISDIIVYIMHHKPEEVVQEGKEDTEYKCSEGPPLNTISVEKHIDGRGADCQVEEVSPEEEHEACKDGVEAKHNLG